MRVPAGTPWHHAHSTGPLPCVGKWRDAHQATSSSGRASQRLHALPSCSIDSAQVVGAVVTQVDITFVGREHLEQLRTHKQRLSRWQMRWGIGSLHGGTQGK